MTMLKPNSVLQLVNDLLWPQFKAERERLDRIDRWYRGDQPAHRLPRGATPENKALWELSKTPWLGLVVTSIAQTLFVDGYRSASDAAADEADPTWMTWLANDMPKHQTAINRAALGYGYSFASVMPGVIDDPTGAPVANMARIKGYSPRRVQAVYEDPALDKWPGYAIEAVPTRTQFLVNVYDEQYVYTLQADVSGGRGAEKFTYLQFAEHGVGVCPFVRFTNLLDLDGRTPGEVEPLVPLAARIDKTDYDRMLVQHFNSWKKITVAGLADTSGTPEEANRAKLKLRQDDILVAEDTDTKFGVLPETEMTSFINAKKSDVEALAAVSQVPPTSLAPGSISNISADAIAELHSGLENKAFERKTSFGVSYNQLLAKAAQIEGRSVDPRATVTWQDMSVRSISAAADAYGKFVQMLQIPPAAFWSKIPGVTQSDVEEWRAMATRAQGTSLLQGLIASRATAALGDQVSAGSDAVRDEQ